MSTSEEAAAQGPRSRGLEQQSTRRGESFNYPTTASPGEGGPRLPPHEERETPPVVKDVHRRLDALAIAGGVFLALTIVMIAISFTVPWWASFANGEMSSWYLSTVCTAGSCSGYGTNPSLAGAFGLSNALVLVGLFLFMFAAVAFSASLVWPRLGSVTLALGLVGSVLLLGAPLYLYFSLPGALTSSGFPAPVDAFFGSWSGGGTSYSWTGGAGWYLAFLIVPSGLAGSAAAWGSTRRHVVEERAIESLTSLEVHTAEEPPPPALPPEEPGPRRFCPLCGARYPDTVDFCAKDSEPLKDVVP